MTLIQLRAPDVDLDVTLADDTLKPLLGELQIVSPLLADKIQHAAFEANPNFVQLEERDLELLAAAARVVSNSLVDDPGLDQIARLAE